MSRRWAVCRVCGEGFAPRTLNQDVCHLSCFYNDPRRRTGYPMKLLQAERKRGRTLSPAVHGRRGFRAVRAERARPRGGLSASWQARQPLPP